MTLYVFNMNVDSKCPDKKKVGGGGGGGEGGRGESKIRDKTFVKVS